MSVAEHTRYVSVAEQNDFNDINNQGSTGDKQEEGRAQPPQMRLRTYKLRAALASRNNGESTLPDREFLGSTAAPLGGA